MPIKAVCRKVQNVYDMLLDALCIFGDTRAAYSIASLIALVILDICLLNIIMITF